MKTVKIYKDQIERAKELYPFKNLNNSITKGESNIYGALGEIIINDLFLQNGFEVDFSSTFDYDLKINGFNIDVKTKKTKVQPSNNYLCSIVNDKQKCDFYFFLRINENFEECYLLGYISKNDFFQKATYNLKGTKDINGFEFKADCYNLEISKLNEFNQI